MKIRLNSDDAAQIAAEQSQVDALAAMIQKDQQNLELRKELLSRLLKTIIQGEGGRWIPGQCSITNEDGVRYLVTPDADSPAPAGTAGSMVPLPAVNGAAA